MVTLISGCSMIPSIPKLSSFGIKKEESKSTEVTVAAKVAAQAAHEVIEKTSEVERKVIEEKAKMEAEYAKLKEETKKAYEDLKKKDQDNFDKIAELNYGIYHVTQEKKKIDISSAIAHLRSTEIMMRTDKLTDDKKTKIQQDVADEKTKTIDQLYAKYNVTISLAVTQKAALDEADLLIHQKEKEKAEMKEANRIALEKAEAEKKAEIERVRAEAADQVRLIKEAQKEQILQYTIYILTGLGILFIIIGVLMKNISMIGSGATFLGLAYGAASIPVWVIALIACGLVIVSTMAKPFLKSKSKDIPLDQNKNSE